MKIALIGGAGLRCPLLVRGLAMSGLPIDYIDLYDSDFSRLGLIAAVARELAPSVQVRVCEQADDCMRDADFVFVSIRPGGMERRAHDEGVALEHGIVGQETVGPAGFAMAMRTIPAVLEYATRRREMAPAAFLINFTNPVGMVTQAAADARVIGICDTPTELFEEVARVLGLPSAACHFDYVGLNHLGWLREVYHMGEPQMVRLWSRPDLLSRIYRAPFFEIEFLQQLRLLPTEYLYFYYRAAQAVTHLRAAGETRGRVLQRMNEQLFEALRDSGTQGNRVDIYQRYLSARNGSYMRLESASTDDESAGAWSDLTGYDKFALSVVRALWHNENRILPLNVRNGSNLEGLEPQDVVEVPCVVGQHGVEPLHVTAPPESVAGLLGRVKEYERKTVAAALSGKREDAIAALTANPLVPDEGVAERLASRLLGPVG
jgi:6-phospho-beta-glucosidase